MKLTAKILLVHLFCLCLVQVLAQSTDEKLRPARKYAFKENGSYNETHISYVSGTLKYASVLNPGKFFENHARGFSLHHVTGYQHNRWVGAGVGLGVDHYSEGFGYDIFPIYLEGRGYFLKEKVSPFYSVCFGYGFIWADHHYNAVIKGGSYLNYSVGLRFGAHPRANVTLALGRKIQNVVLPNRYRISRLNLKLGLLF